MLWILSLHHLRIISNAPTADARRDQSTRTIVVTTSVPEEMEGGLVALTRTFLSGLRQSSLSASSIPPFACVVWAQMCPFQGFFRKSHPSSLPQMETGPPSKTVR